MLTEEQQRIYEVVIGLGQETILFQGEESPKKLASVLDQLLVVDRFYNTIGGLKGYVETVRELLQGTPEERQTFSAPPAQELSDSAVRFGLETLPQMAEIYPIGGAGDRLGLVDEMTGTPLPAACLQFGGRSLLEGLLRDLQAKEKLYAQLFGKQLITPIVLMTSHEKENDRYVREILERSSWFGRPKESFFFCIQDLVPCMTEEGNLAVRAPCELWLKPGGHGVLWKLMEDSGAFDWLAKQGRRKALVRQINNPIAGTDNGLLGFTGIGCHEDKGFGFATCQRKVGAAEGTIVLNETTGAITNIEYTEFAKQGIEDAPAEPGSEYSCYPANTNILFVDLEAVRQKTEECLLPGILINMKKTAPCLLEDGRVGDLHYGRLETTMQNIADCFEERNEFITTNKRRKTISVTKNGWSKGKSTSETPVGAYLDVQENGRELLEQCGLAVGKEVHFLYKPSLGPLYSVIAQKVRGGKIADGSELHLEIDELEMTDLDLDGSLLIEGGRCRLQNVSVRNRGIDRSADNRLWKNDVTRDEALEIVIDGSGEFYAEDVILQGSMRIHVADGVRLRAHPDGAGIRFEEEPIDAPTWEWTYSFDGDEIRLEVQELMPGGTIGQ